MAQMIKKSDEKWSTNHSTLTIISKNCQVKGEFRDVENIHVEGDVEGDILNVGSLMVGSTGSVSGNVTAENVIVFGRIKGNIVAKVGVEIRKTGQVKGGINTQILSVEFGGVCAGRIVMGSVLPAAGDQRLSDHSPKKP